MATNWEKSLRVFSVPKRDDTPNEDRWGASADGRIIAISDGASVSFDSATWAEIICRRFVSDPAITPEWVQSAATEYRAAYDREAMPWMQQGAFDRGSFGTLLGAIFSETCESVRVLAVGDSVFALFDRARCIQVIPCMQPADFDLSPNLLSTNPVENAFITAEFIASVCHDLSLTELEEPHFLFMTDALGRWFIEGPDAERLSALLAIQSAEEFSELIERERSEGRMKRDDTTLIVMG